MNREPDRTVELVTCHSVEVKDLLAALGLSSFPVAKLVIEAVPGKLVEVRATLYVPETKAQAMVEAFKQEPNSTVKSIGLIV
jgi:hypothetical protein